MLQPTLLISSQRLIPSVSATYLGVTNFPNRADPLSDPQWWWQPMDVKILEWINGKNHQNVTCCFIKTFAEENGLYWTIGKKKATLRWLDFHTNGAEGRNRTGMPRGGWFWINCVYRFRHFGTEVVCGERGELYLPEVRMQLLSHQV